MSHTPGPWSIVRSVEGYPIGINAPRERWTIPGAVGSIVRANGIGLPTSDEAHANARLIAAAPELLEALRQVRDCEPLNTRHGDIARAAIAKAEGK